MAALPQALATVHGSNARVEIRQHGQCLVETWMESVVHRMRTKVPPLVAEVPGFL